jgi:hypothetical protein
MIDYPGGRFGSITLTSNQGDPLLNTGKIEQRREQEDILQIKEIRKR